MPSIPLSFGVHNVLNSGPPSRALVILHGLFGSRRNWRTIGEMINKTNRIPVFTVDLRNHGQTFREQGICPMTWETMSSDLNALLETIACDRVTLMGHSLGGQVVMQSLFRGLSSSAIKQVIMVDVAPRPIQFIGSQSHTLLERMIELENSDISSRSSAQKFMSDIEPDSRVVQFLLSNGAMKEGNFKFNIPLLELFQGMSNLQETYGDPSSKPACNIQALFIKGEKSDFIRNPEDYHLISHLFPNSKIKLILDAGHWPHYDRPEEFCRVVGQFLQSNPNIS